MNARRTNTLLTLPSTIGIFDSGSGGLSILQELLKIGTFSYIFFADTAHLPYGQKSPEYLLERGKIIAHFFQNRGITTVIVACHTFSATALPALRELFPHMTFIDMLMPTVHNALIKTCNKKIGILATQTTITSQYHKKMIHALDNTIEVVQQACPAFVPLVEQGSDNALECFNAAQLYTEIMQKTAVDTIILGCTHYSFLEKTLTQLLPKVHLISASTLVQLLFTFDQKQNNPTTMTDGLFVVTGEKDIFSTSINLRITVKHTYSIVSSTGAEADRNSGLRLNNSSSTPLTNL